MATETWSGIVVRATLSENGTVPRSASSSSPDIILAGKEPLAVPSVLTDPANYNNGYDNKLYIGLPNYLYVRGKNYTAGDLAGYWNLFWATPNILLYPYLWQGNQLKTSGGDKNPPFAIKAGAIGASLDCFTWVPPDTSDHYCMIAVASTPGHSNPLEGVTKITDLAEVLSKNANIAQRNVQMVRGDLPQVVSTAGYNQGAEGALVDLAVVFENIPKGTKYTISSGTPLNGKTLSHSDNNTLDNDFKYAWVGQDIPANWQTLFTFTLSFGSDWSGIPAGKKPKVTIRGELVQGSADRLYHNPAAYFADPHPHTRAVRLDATGGPVKLIVAGSVTTLYTDIGPK
ncbi:hypothetical protein [Pseudomonas entomophila]|uniref:hypothetical protein n=1 Tax=Pseudomonas entomophila TaxID=312306 RepID=UPI001EFF66EF|nr:hypothetical protein [Pseudomonas entomophila]MCG8295111.1 hypothetical protein [Pseudomonas entomophila]